MNTTQTLEALREFLAEIGPLTEALEALEASVDGREDWQPPDDGEWQLVAGYLRDHDAEKALSRLAETAGNLIYLIRASEGDG